MTKFCPFCGERLVDEAKFCKNCGKNVEKYQKVSDSQSDRQTYQPPAVEKSYTIATVIGFLCALLFPLFGIIIGIYLATRNDSTKAKRYGYIMIAVGAIVWILSFITAMVWY